MLKDTKKVSGFKVTSHMQFYKDKEIKDKVEAEGQSISNVLGKTSEEREKSNLLCIQMLIEVTKLCLEMRVAPFNNFKELVGFMVDHKAEDLTRMKRWAKNATLCLQSICRLLYTGNTSNCLLWNVERDVLHRDNSRRESSVCPYDRHCYNP